MKSVNSNNETKNFWIARDRQKDRAKNFGQAKLLLGISAKEHAKNLENLISKNSEFSKCGIRECWGEMQHSECSGIPSILKAKNGFLVPGDGS